MVSAFSRMVEYYRNTQTAYDPLQFVDDVLNNEIMVSGYGSRIHELLRSPDINDGNRQAVKFLAAFPSGVRTEILREQGYEEALRPLARSGSLVIRTPFSMRLKALQTVKVDTDLIADTIAEIDGEYAQDRRTFELALSAFAREVIPAIFPERQGQQLNGWQYTRYPCKVGRGLLFGTLLGAFPQMSGRFPSRAAMLIVHSADIPWDTILNTIDLPELDPTSGPQRFDLVFQFVLRWNDEQPAFSEPAEIQVGKNHVRIRVNIDLTKGVVQQDRLCELVGSERPAPLWILYLFERMNKVQLAREYEAEWEALREMLIRQLVPLFLDDEFGKALASQIKAVIGDNLSGSGLTLLDQATNALLSHFYPEYQTLIRQPHWQSRIDDYINALRNEQVPLACRRGREIWKADAEEAARVLGTSRMNLTGGTFKGFENLIEITTTGRNAPLQIAFHIHPLEEKIRNLVCLQEIGPERKLKKQGKECWYINQSDLPPLVYSEGYTVEEFRKIVEIGKARGSYDTATHRGEDILYCMPIDPAELRAQLRAKLADLKAEIEEYRKIEAFGSTFDVDLMAREIEKVEDDADYEKLASRMNREFETNHNRLPGYFDSLSERLRQVGQKSSTLDGQVLGSRDIRQIRLPTAKSSWGADLGRYIVPNLQQSAKECYEQLQGLLKKVNAATLKYTHSHQRSPSNNLALLLEGASVANDLQTQYDRVHEQARVLLQHTRDFDKWVTLLRQSDDLLERLMALDQTTADGGQASALLAEHDRIANSISEYIQVRNVSGLQAYAQFEEQIEDLERKRQDYQRNLKGSFDACKAKVNQLLEEIGLDRHVGVVFDQEDVVGSYERLYSEAATTLAEAAWQRLQSEIDAQVRELKYARDILQAIDLGKAQPLLDALGSCRQKVDELSKITNAEWMRRAIESEGNVSIQEVSDCVKAGNEAIREARKKLNEISVPSLPEDGLAKTLHDMLPDAGSKDLKELVLHMMSVTPDPSRALDISTRMLVELFRRNCVQVTVSRRRR